MRKALVLALAVCALSGLATPARAELIYAVTTTNALLSFDSATPGTITTVAISGLQASESILALDLRPATGQLFAIGDTSRLYTINPLTGAATQVGAAGAFTLSGGSFGFDFNPTVDRIRVVSEANQNLRLNPNDGALTATDTPLAYAAGDPNAGQDPGVGGSAYTNNFGGATTTTLYGIDGLLDILVTQIPPNAGTLNTVGPLGVNVAPVLMGFDISGLTGIAYASFGASLYTINLTTGAATLIGAIGGPSAKLAVMDITVGVQGPVATPTPTATSAATATPTTTATSAATATPTTTATATATVSSGPAPAVPTLSGLALALLALFLGMLGFIAARSGTGS
jgi:hypothetical protein